MNPGRIFGIRRFHARHADSKTFVFVDYLDQGRAIAKALGAPFVGGETRHRRRGAYFETFRNGDLDTFVVSRIGDEDIDLPSAGLAIITSDLGNSCR